jgi:hypothetical protein
MKLAVFLALLAAVPVFGHHSFAAEFDAARARHPQRHSD